MTAVRLKGIKRYRSRGRIYLYHRATGTRLHASPGTPAFIAELAAADAKIVHIEERPGTWGALASAYRSSPRFLTEIKPRTRADYLRVFSWLSPLHTMPLPDFTRGFAMKLRDKAHHKKGRRFANYVQSVVSLVFAWGFDRELADHNPAAGMKKIRRPKDAPRANRPWLPSEWRVATSEAPLHLLAPILIMGTLGWREGEAIAAPKTAYDRRTGMISRISSKSGKPVRTPCPAVIVRAIDNLLPHDAITLLVSSRGHPWSEGGFRSSFFKFIGRLEKEGKIGDGLTAHGLRHTCATRLRELGYDTRTIADMLGQETEGMAALYSREADLEKKLTGVVRRLERENGKAPRSSNRRTRAV